MPLQCREFVPKVSKSDPTVHEHLVRLIVLRFAASGS